ncbi:glycosyltransferase family 4 protein [Candidatus Viridilinea mediisalina]|uniref:Glycosyl transferase family 1 n=1 Tax=Candidatus Viridilinea mediisalina TaxID=2024553 RepID=A0A2A6RIM8_9CHLR|nr:glycosyltransferase family 4 protein [Candidatus Viridilinea mediisalina]PDW02739.1 glycosyl transferase family 1 [Candidatus Viridilinea mediisalina]
MSNQILLTVSGIIPPDRADQADRGQRQRADYHVLAEVLGADLFDVAAARQATGMFGRLLERIAGQHLLLAWATFQQRRHYQLIFSDGEQIGLPLALLLKMVAWLQPKRPRHMMIAHVLSVPKKMVFLDLFKIQSHIDTFLVYASAQKQFIEQRWKLPSERVVLTPFMVDTTFFRPDAVVPTPRERPMICSVGLERRDYPTLMRAVADLPVDVMILAASPWSRRTDGTEGQALPANVRLQKFNQCEPRQLYADSTFLVMPLQPVDFQAGVTVILEALAMERPVICSRIPGQTDVIVEGQHGLYVTPSDPAALRVAIEYLLAHPDQCTNMGRNGRRLVEQQMSLEVYAAGLAREAQKLLEAV